MKIFNYADLGSKRSWDYYVNGLTLIIDNAAYGVTSLSGKGCRAGLR